MNDNSVKTAEKFRNVETFLDQEIFVERSEHIRAMSLALVANTNILMLGDPGVAKSLLATQWVKHIKNGKYFEWLLDPYTTPDEIVGHISIKKFQEDELVRNVENSMHNAHIVFLDEFWKSNGGVINNLLPTLNERVYFNGGKKVKSPILTIIAASNELPEQDDHLEAALDRFVIKVTVPTIKEKSNWITMMERFLDPSKEERELIDLKDIKELQKEAKTVKVNGVLMNKVLKIKNLVEKETSQRISPRVINNSLRVIQANAAINGRSEATDKDLLVLRHTLWVEPEHYDIVHRVTLQNTFPYLVKVNKYESEAKALVDDYNNLDFSEDKVYPKVFGILKSLKGIKDKLEIMRQEIVSSGGRSKEIDNVLTMVTDKADTIFMEHGQRNKKVTK